MRAPLSHVGVCLPRFADRSSIRIVDDLPMDSREGTIRSVAWRDVFPWVLLVRTLRISLRVPVLLTAFAGYLLTLLGGWLIGGVLFADVEDPWIGPWHREFLAPVSAGWLEQPAGIPGGRALNRPPFAAEYVASPPVEPGSLRVPGTPGQPHRQPIIGRVAKRAADAPAAAWWTLAAPLVHLFHPHLTATALSYLLLRNVWNILVWAFFGGMIARMAAFELTRRESLGIERASSQAVMRLPAHVLAPLIAAAALLLAALPLVVAGIFLRLEVVAWIAGMLWFAILVVGLLLAVLVIGLVAGWPLMWAAIAVEQSDAFDAVSRAYAYVYQRPLHLAGYVVIIVLLGILGAAAVGLFAFATIELADWAIGWGSGDEVLARLQETGTESTEEGTWMSGAAAGRSLWIRAVLALTAAYPIGFLWCAAVGMYLLLRWHVDGAQTDEIADDELETPTRLPVLKPHESGIPEVERRPGDSGPREASPPE